MRNFSAFWAIEQIAFNLGNRSFDSANTTTPASCTSAVCNPTFSASTNRISSSGYTFDADGNLTEDAEGYRFGYDSESRQNEYFDKNNSSSTPDATYYYDGEGQRVKKISSTETTVFVYDGMGRMIAEYSTDLAETQQVSYLTTDHLGSPRLITNEIGQVVKRQDFAAFGDETLTAARVSALGYTTADDLRQDYTGYQKDDESGLEYAQSRYYNARLGRFSSVDPLPSSATLRNPQTLNRYSYVFNAPYQFVDPLGLIYLTNNNGKDIIWIPDGVYEKNEAFFKNKGYSIVPEGTRFDVGEGSTGIFAPYVGATVILGPNGNLTPVMPDGVSPVQSERADDDSIQQMLNGTEETLWFWRPAIYVSSPIAMLPALPIAGPLASGGSAVGGGLLELGVVGGETLSAATPEIATGVAQVLSNANNVNHIFAAKHLLDSLLIRFGSQAGLMTAVLNQIASRLPSSGPFRETITISGVQLVVTGSVVNGVPLVSNMWVPMTMTP